MSNLGQDWCQPDQRDVSSMIWRCLYRTPCASPASLADMASSGWTLDTTSGCAACAPKSSTAFYSAFPALATCQWQGASWLDNVLLGKVFLRLCDDSNSLGLKVKALPCFSELVANDELGSKETPKGGSTPPPHPCWFRHPCTGPCQWAGCLSQGKVTESLWLQSSVCTGLV